jgi:hypothetical protein
MSTFPCLFLLLLSQAGPQKDTYTVLHPTAAAAPHFQPDTTSEGIMAEAGQRQQQQPRTQAVRLGLGPTQASIEQQCWQVRRAGDILRDNQQRVSITLQRA